MSNARNLPRDFLALLDPDEPQHGCTVLAEYLDRESKHRTAMAKTLRQIVLDPLDWYIQSSWEKHGPNFCGLDSANAFRLAADNIRYRLTCQMSICTEEIEALETKWVKFQAAVGWNNWVRLAPLATADKKFRAAQRWKASRPRSRIIVDGGKFSITSIVQNLAKRKDALGGWVPTDDLWMELFSELDRIELEPEESADRIEFTKNDNGEIGQIKKLSFRTLVSRARRKTE